jgi:hypothetical protein
MKLLLVLCIILPFTAFAQTWSEQEQELLDHIAMIWDAWMEAVDQKNVEIFVEKSNQAKNSLMWWTTQGAPEGLDAVRRNWESISTTDVNWIDIRPVAIRIYENVGIVYFYGYWTAKTEDGSVTTEYKRTEVYLKVDGKWSFIGGQGTPVSPKDAEPYE